MPSRFVHLLAALALATVTAACGANAASAPADAPVDGDAVVLTDNEFQPAALRVTAGTTVTWTWDDGSAQHNVVFDDDTASPAQSQGTWTRTFDEPGTFAYVCTLHPRMTGTVVLEGGYEQA